MAITIPATGSGTQNPPVATEIIGGEHYQFFKLVDGNVGSAAAVGTSANPLNVFQPGVQTIIGSVGMTQLGAPWSVVGSVFTGPNTVTLVGSTLIQSSLTVFQGAAPWSVVGSVFVATNSPFLMEGDTSAGSLDDINSNPIKIGGYSVGSSFPTAVASGGIRVNAAFDRVGRQLVAHWAPLTLSQNKHNDFLGPASGTIVWTPGVANRVCVTDLRVVAGSATAGIVSIYFARSGAPINFTVGSGVCLFRGEMAPSATAKPGAVMTFPYPTVGDANDALRISITTTMEIYVQVGGFEAP